MVEICFYIFSLNTKLKTKNNRLKQTNIQNALGITASKVKKIISGFTENVLLGKEWPKKLNYFNFSLFLEIFVVGVYWIVL